MRRARARQARMGESHRWGPHCLPTPSLLFPHPRSPHTLQHAGLLKLLSHVPWKQFPRIESSYCSSWETLLQSPVWGSGYSKGRIISRNDAGRCHIIKQALSLSSQHPGLTQVRFSGHRDPPVSPWGPFFPCRVKPIFSRYLQESLTLPTQYKLSVVCSQFFLLRGPLPSVLHHLHLQHPLLSLVLGSS